MAKVDNGSEPARPERADGPFAGRGARRDGPLERDHELRCLDAALQSAAEGKGALAVIEGGAGLGKSRLLDSAHRRSEELGLLGLSGRGEELESTLPWSLARALLAPALADATPRRRRALLSGAAAPAAAVLDPESVPAYAGVGESQLPLAHAVFWVIAGIAAASPLALLVDDAHWADEPSLHLLCYLARRLSDLPVALIVAHRPRPSTGEPYPLDRLAADPASTVLELAPLSAAAAGTLARERLGPQAEEELVVACAEVTGGNPFYLEELLRAIAASAKSPVSAETVRTLVPAAVSRSLFLRLVPLGSEVGALARAAAILGDRATLPHAAELAEIELARAAAALDELAVAEILLAGEPLRFIHPLVAAAIHDDIPPSERAAWHLRAAKILDRDGVGSDRTAPHLLATGARGDPWVVERLHAAAHAAAAQGGAAAAAAYLSRALEEPPPRESRAVLLTELGRLESALGRSTAPDRLRAALELTDRGEERTSLFLELGRALVVTGAHAQAAKAFESGLEAAEQPASELARELRAAWWMAASVDPVERARVIAAGDPDIGDDRQRPTLGQRQLSAQLGQERAFGARPPRELCALAERAWGDGELLAGETSDGLTWSLVTGTLLAADALEREIDVCDAVIADARRRGSPMAYATASYCRAVPLMRRGQLSDAIADAQAAVAAREDGWATFLPMAAACLAIAQVERGSLDESAEALALLEEGGDLERSNQHAMVLLARGRLLTAEGRFERAIVTLRHAGESLASVGFDNPTLFPWRAWATHAAVQAGEGEEARRLAAAAVAAAEQTQVPVTIAQALRAKAAVSGEEDAIEHLREGLALIARLPRRLERAHLLVDLGAALRRIKQRADAIAVLRRGLALARDGGALALADRARAELAAAGARVKRERRRDGLDSLTPSELRVAELAAAGHSNKEIAQMLFVTVKAVEYHLGNTYRKLGINRRGQLAPLLGEVVERQRPRG